MLLTAPQTRSFLLCVQARPKLLPTHSLADELGALDIMAVGPPEPAAPPAVPAASAPAGAQLVETVESLQMQLADRDKTIDHLRQLMSELRTEVEFLEERELKKKENF